MSAPRVVCLVGPTASGKTTLALELGAEFASANHVDAALGEIGQLFITRHALGLGDIL